MPRELLTMQNNFNWETIEGQTLQFNNAIKSGARDLKIEGQTYQNLVDENNVKLGNYSYNAGTGEYSLTNPETDKWNELRIGYTRPVYDGEKLLIRVNIIKNTIVTTSAQSLKIAFSGDNNVGQEAINISNNYTGIFEFYCNSVIASVPDKIRISTRNYTSGELVIKDIQVIPVLSNPLGSTELPTSINGIESVAEREKEGDLYKVRLTNKGKNLLDLSTFIPILNNVTETSINENIITVRGLTLGSVEAYTELKANNLKVYLEEGKTYSFSFKSDAQFGPTVGTDTVEIFFMLEATLKNYFNVLGQKTVTIPAGCSGDYYVRFDVNSGNKTHTFYDIQVEEGDTVTNYEPYLKTTTEIPLPQPLRSLPNGIKDTIEGNKLVQRVDKIILDGSRNYTRHSSLSFNDMSLFYFANANINKTSHIGISSKLPCYDIAERANCLNNQKECIILSDDATGLVQIILKNTSLATQDVAGLKEYLRANPITLYYELATPIEQPISVPRISIAKGSNTITTINNIKPNLSIKYKKSKK